jgi:hypothetical protein
MWRSRLFVWTMVVMSFLSLWHGFFATRLMSRDFAHVRRQRYWEKHTSTISHQVLHVNENGLRGVVADRDMIFGDVVSIHPRQEQICEADIPTGCSQGVISQLCSVSQGAEYQRCSKLVKQALFSLYIAARKEHAPKGSRLEAYFASLPTDYDELDAVSAARGAGSTSLDELRPSLQRCMLGQQATKTHRRGVLALEAVTGLGEACALLQAPAGAGVEMAARFSWSSAVMRSRAFSRTYCGWAQREAESMTACLQSAQPGAGACLVPGADLLNHGSPSNAAWSYNEEGDHIIVASRPVAKGAVLYDTYFGSNLVDAEHSVTSYGFLAPGSAIKFVLLPAAQLPAGVVLTSDALETVGCYTAAAQGNNPQVEEIDFLRLPVPVPLDTAGGGKMAFDLAVDPAWASVLSSRGCATRSCGEGLCILQGQGGAGRNSRGCLAGPELKQALCAAIEGLSAEYVRSERTATAQQPPAAIGQAFRSWRSAELAALDLWKSPRLLGC